MDENKRELDIEVIRSLYEFGALKVYKVTFFDRLLFKIVDYCLTFDSDYAEGQYSYLKSIKYDARIETFYVNFHEAFMVKETV